MPLTIEFVKSHFSLCRNFTFNPKEGIDNPLMVITDEAGISHTNYYCSSVHWAWGNYCPRKFYLTYSESPPSPRLCVLKREEIESYGFQLCKEKDRKGHIIRNVVPAGVAESSGLRDGDRLLEVNNCYMDDVPHSEVWWALTNLVSDIGLQQREWRYCVYVFMNQVARKINLSGNQLCLLVLDGDTYKRAVSRGQDLRGAARASRGESYKSPRLCHITRDPVSGLGINFIPVEGNTGLGSHTFNVPH